MKNELVSAILISYNKGRFIAETIECALSQTYPNWELIIVDDGSTDDSQNIIQTYAEKYSHIKTLFLEHGGVSWAINSALRICKGSYVAILSSDDICTPDRFTKSVEAMTRENVQMVTSHAYFINERSERIETPQYLNSAFNHPNRSVEDILLFFVNHGNYICAPGTMFSADLIRKVGKFLEPSLQLQDYDYTIRALEYTNLHIIQEPLVGYRVLENDGNLSGAGSTVRSYNEFFLLGGQLFDICAKKLSLQLLRREAGSVLDLHIYDSLPNDAKSFYLLYLVFLNSQRKEMQLVAFQKMHEFLQAEFSQQTPLFWQHVELMNRYDIFSRLTYEHSRVYLRYFDGSYAVDVSAIELRKAVHRLEFRVNPHKQLYELYFVPSILRSFDLLFSQLILSIDGRPVAGQLRLNGMKLRTDHRVMLSDESYRIRISDFPGSIDSVTLVFSLLQKSGLNAVSVPYFRVSAMARIGFKLARIIRSIKNRLRLP